MTPDFLDPSLPWHAAALLLSLLLVWRGLRALHPTLRGEGGKAARPRLAAHATFVLLVALGFWWPHHWLAGSPGPGLGTAFHVAVSLAAAQLWFVTLVALRRRPPARWVDPLQAFVAALLAAVAAHTAAQYVSAPLHVDPSRLDVAQVLLVACLAFVSTLVRPVPPKERRQDFSPTMQLRLAAVDTDALTQLATRERFEKRLAEAMATSERTGRRLALFFIDLDGFKPVNDTYGHSVGDEVLREVGRRLHALSRSGDLAGRIGGDEFLMLIERIPSDDGAAQVARRLRDSLSRPYMVDQREITISCSIGIATFPGAGSMAKLVAQADVAMYEAKRSGKSTFQFYTSAMDNHADQGMELARELRHAMERKQFELVYQPKIDARSAKVTAAEALLRWRHPQLGDVGPAVFIPVAERFGLMSAISDWVIEEACRQCREWRDKGLRMRVAINLSSQQMRRDDLVAQLVASLKKHRIHPSILTCEVTESLAMEDTKATQATFRRLGQLGVHLSIDDFGTGYSSLSYLRRLPAQELKIDRSFVVDLENSTDARAVVDAVVKLAHALGLKVVAEGVENPRQQQILTQMGCDELQGYLFAKPMSARALLIWALSDPSEHQLAFKASLFGETTVLSDAASTHSREAFERPREDKAQPVRATSTAR